MGTGWKCPSSRSGRPHPTHSHLTVGTHTRSAPRATTHLGPCLWGTGAWSDCHPEKFACRVLTAFWVLQYGVSRASIGGLSVTSACLAVSWTLSQARKKGIPLKAGPPWGQGLCPGCPFPLECLMTWHLQPKGLSEVGRPGMVPTQQRKGDHGAPGDRSSSEPQGLCPLPRAGFWETHEGSSPACCHHRSHNCPCLSVMASGTTSVSPGQRGTACGRPSRTGRSSAPGRTWPPGTRSSRGVCSSLGRNRFVQGQGEGVKDGPHKQHAGHLLRCLPAGCDR